MVTGCVLRTVNDPLTALERLNCIFTCSVFGPTLLRTSESPATLSSVVDTKEQVRVVELMAKYAWDIFGAESNVMPRENDKSSKQKSRREHILKTEDHHEEQRVGKFALSLFMNIYSIKFIIHTGIYIMQKKYGGREGGGG